MNVAQRSLGSKTVGRGALRARHRAGVLVVGLSFVRGVIGLKSTPPSDLFGLSSGTGLLSAFFQWPIFRRGEIRAPIEATDARSDAALARYEQAVLVAVEDIEGALVGYVEEKNVLDRLMEACLDADRAAELARSLYRLGLAAR